MAYSFISNHFIVKPFNSHNIRVFETKTPMVKTVEQGVQKPTESFIVASVFNILLIYLTLSYAAI